MPRTALDPPIQILSSDRLLQLAQESESDIEKLGDTPSGDICWDTKATCLGLICGSFATDIELVANRLALPYCVSRDAQVLVLFSDPSSPGNTPCFLAESVNSKSVRVLVSPLGGQEASSVYGSSGAIPVPLRIDETSITKRHLLGLFTPPDDMPGRGSILSTIQLVISQLSQPFDIKEMIARFDQEQWSSESINFIAMRQTLLTSLLSDESDLTSIRSAIGSGQPVILHLDDPVLVQSGMHNILMDMVVHAFLSDSPARRKLILLHNSQEYLHPETLLSSTVDSLAHLGNARPASVLITSHNPSKLSSDILSSLDLVFCGEARSLLWKAPLIENLGGDWANKHRSKRGQVTLWIPDLAWPTTACDADHAFSAQRFVYLGHDQVRTRVAELREAFRLHEMANIPEDTSSSFQQSGSHLDPPGVLKTDAPPTMQSPRQAEESGDEDEMFDEEGMVPLSAIPDTHVFWHPNLTAAPSWTIATFQAQAMANLAETTAVSRMPRSKFVFLMEAITTSWMSSSDHPEKVLVAYTDLRAMLGNTKGVKELGWQSYPQLIAYAYAQGVVDLIRSGKNVRFINLLPAGTPSLLERNKALIPSSKVVEGWDLTNCPLNIFPLVAAILLVTRGKHRAQLTWIAEVFGATKEDMILYGWKSIRRWLKAAEEEQWIKIEGKKFIEQWIELGPTFWTTATRSVRDDQNFDTSATQLVREENTSLDGETNLVEKATMTKDSDAPRKALSPYMFFTREWRQKLKDENPGIGFGDLAKMLTAKWKEMSEKEKQVYVMKHQADKERAEAEKQTHETKDSPSVTTMKAPSVMELPRQPEESDDEDEDEMHEEGQEGLVSSNVLESHVFLSPNPPVTPVWTIATFQAQAIASSPEMVAAISRLHRPQFTFLIEAIIASSMVSTDTPDRIIVGYEVLRTALGNNKGVKERGWSSYTHLIAYAYVYGIVDLIRLGKAVKFLNLLPVGTPSLLTRSAAHVPSSKIVEGWNLARCPPNLFPLLAAILLIGKGERRAPFASIAEMVGATKEDTMMYGWKNINKWLKAAKMQGWVNFEGKKVGSKSIELGPTFRRMTVESFGA